MKKDFHFVLNKRLKIKVIRISKKLKLSHSMAVVYIINNMLPFIERYYYSDIKDKRGNYNKFGANAFMHAYLDKTTYNLLKHFTHNMYIYSMAIVVRRILEIFVKCVDKYGLVDFIEWLNHIKNKHTLRMAKISKLKKVQHMSHLIKCVDENFNYKIEFNQHFEIIGFDFSP